MVRNVSNTRPWCRGDSKIHLVWFGIRRLADHLPASQAWKVPVQSAGYQQLYIERHIYVVYIYNVLRYIICIIHIHIILYIFIYVQNIIYMYICMMISISYIYISLYIYIYHRYDIIFLPSGYTNPNEVRSG